jgi:hypothetical protein
MCVAQDLTPFLPRPTAGTSELLGRSTRRRSYYCRSLAVRYHKPMPLGPNEAILSSAADRSKKPWLSGTKSFMPYVTTGARLRTTYTRLP